MREPATGGDCVDSSTEDL